MAVHPNNQGGVLARTNAENQSPQAAMPGEIAGQAPSGAENVSGEEQDAYDKVVMAGMTVLFENETSKAQIVERLKADADNPAKSLADTTAMLMIQLDQQSGGNIPETVILPAAVELLEQASELADSLQIFPVDEAVMNHAAQLMVVSLGEEYGVEPEEINELMNSIDSGSLKQIEEQQGAYARKQPPREVT